MEATHRWRIILRRRGTIDTKSLQMRDNNRYVDRNITHTWMATLYRWRNANRCSRGRGDRATHQGGNPHNYMAVWADQSLVDNITHFHRWSANCQMTKPTHRHVRNEARIITSKPAGLGEIFPPLLTSRMAPNALIATRLGVSIGTVLPVMRVLGNVFRLNKSPFLD